MAVTVRASLDDGFSFGWRHLARALREHLWIYVAIALIGSVWTGWAAMPDHYQTAEVEWIAMFPALAGATRLFVPSFTMQFRHAAAIFDFLIAEIAALGLAVGAIILLARFVSIAFVLLVFVLIPIVLWIEVKTCLSTAFYTLKEQNGHGLIDALKDSWSLVTGSVWWTIAGFALAVCLVFAVPVGVVGWLNFATITRPGGVPVALLSLTTLPYYALSITSTVWVQTSCVAFAAALGAEDPKADS